MSTLHRQPHLRRNPLNDHSPVTTPQIHFYDSASPQNIPSGSYAGVYINGHTWDRADIQRMRRIFAISVFGSPLYAKVARCIDIENFAATPDDAVPFIQHRIALGHHDGTVYVNRSNIVAVHERLQAAKLTALYWVATLDGTVEKEFDGIPAWAVQYQNAGNRYDLSVLLGVDNFRRP